MPTEIIKEFVGKNCSITIWNNAFGEEGKIVTVEGNWVKVEYKNKVKLINGDMIQQIELLPEKHQK
ncbi:MAG: hypothetical protein LBL91_01715 [Lachnospiraceae bacterium]|nr:hypothetical protein [Lachnospiraceae bacterium]